MLHQPSAKSVTRWLVLSASLVGAIAVHCQTPVTQRVKLVFSPDKAESPQPTPEPSPTPSPNAFAILAPQIADQAIQLKQRLSALTDNLAPDSFFADFEQQLNVIRDTIGTKTAETDSVVQSRATLSQLDQIYLDRQSLAKHVTDLAETLSKQSKRVEDQTALLREAQKQWAQTHDELVAGGSPIELVDIATNAQNEIAAALVLAENQRARIGAIQQAVVAQNTILTGDIEKIGKAISESRRSLFEADSPPLWRVQFQRETDRSGGRFLRRAYRSDFQRLGGFLWDERHSVFVIAMITVAALILFVSIASQAVSDHKTPGDGPQPIGLFDRPYSLALLVGLGVSMPLLGSPLIAARSIADLLAVIPVTRLLFPRVKPLARRLLLAIIISGLIWQVIKLIHGPVWLVRDLLAIACIAIAILTGLVLRRAGSYQVSRLRGTATIHLALSTTLFLIMISLLANIFGYLGLSDLIGNGTLVSAYQAVAIYTLFVVGQELISFLLRANRTQRLTVVRKRAPKINRWMSVGLALICIFFWLRSTLNLYLIRDYVYHQIVGLLTYQITLGTAHFAPSDILLFILILVVGYQIAVIVRAILADEVLPRLTLALGMQNAIATISHYLALLFIFLLALAASGIELSKFAILTGAFGVGLGFGLQNIVNNFVSGLILLFERPVRVGDFLEIAGISGVVTKIGFRSSTLHSTEGGDLIVPNANLISQQVMNWTLSGVHRLVAIRFKAAFGNNPGAVRDLLLTTVSGHDEVMKAPSPAVLFLGNNARGLEFEIRFWVSRSDIVLRLKSEIALSVAAAFETAGIEVAFPIRDMYLRSIDESARQALELIESATSTEPETNTRV